MARLTAQASAPAGKPVEHTLLASVDDAHGVYDVNCVSWCRLQPPSRASDDMADDDAETAAERDSDGRFARAHLMFATAGDDGAARVWRLKL